MYLLSTVMAEWFNTPTVLIAGIAVLGLVCKVIFWIAGVNLDRRELSRRADEDREAWTKRADEDREAWTKRADHDRDALMKRADEEREAWTKRLAEEREAWTKRADDDRDLLTKRLAEEREAWTKRADEEREAWTKRADEDRASLLGFMAEVRKDIKQIFLRLPSIPISGGSPFQLTDFGEKIAKQLEAGRWASELAGSVLDEVREMEPFEIDEFCDEYGRTRLSADWQVRVARCAYEFGIDKQGVRSVLRVVLRNELLARLGRSP